MSACQALAVTLCLLALPMGLVGCSTSTKQTLMRSALEDEGSRKEWFEATLRILDKNPRYVDEFYRMARHHEPTLERFIQNTSRDLEDEKLAKLTARYLVSNPAALRQIMVQTLRASTKSRKARAAIADAIQQQRENAARISAENPKMIRYSMSDTLEIAPNSPQVQRAITVALSSKVDAAGDVITEDPDLVYDTMIATVENAADKPDARHAFVRAMHATSPTLAGILAHNPRLVTKMMQELAEALHDDPEALKDIALTLTKGIVD